MSNSIKQWLIECRDYNVGVALFNAYSDNRRMRDMFAQGHSEYRMERLIAALRELEKAAGRTEVAAADAEPRYNPVSHSKIILPENKVPEEKDPFRSQWLPLYKERNFLRAQLEGYTSDFERGQAAFRIIELQDKVQAIWDQRDYYVRTGHMPAVAAGKDPVTDPAALSKRLLNLRTYISKLKAKIDAGDRSPKLLARLQEFEQEKSTIEKILNDETSKPEEDPAGNAAGGQQQQV